jgi:hypothetical protein
MNPFGIELLTPWRTQTIQMARPYVDVHGPSRDRGGPVGRIERRLFWSRATRIFRLLPKQAYFALHRKTQFGIAQMG